MIDLIGLVSCGVLLVMSAFFSAAETGLVALSSQKAKRIALKDEESAEALLGWLGKPQELLTIILAGNTLTNVLFAAILAAISVRMFATAPRSRVEFFTWLIGTGGFTILAEMAPKFFAKANPERTCMLALPWLSRVRDIFSPLLKIVSRLMNRLFPHWKAPPVSPALMFSLDELKLLLEEGRTHSAVSPESVSMMTRALEIHDRRIESIMTPIEKADVIDLDPPGRPPRSKELLIDLIVENGHTRTPIRQSGEIIGYIHSDDLLPLMLRPNDRPILEMLRQAADVPADRRVADQLQEFRTSGIHFGFVRDANRRVIGLVTLEDVLEEITGDILDEFDVSAGTPPPSL